jgi:hypothetical protein
MITILTEEEAYQGKGNGFTLKLIDGILLGVYNYTSLGATSFIELPIDIANKKSSN